MSAGETSGTSPGIVSMAEPWAAKRRAAAVTAPVWPSRAPSLHTRAPRRKAMSAAAGSMVTTAMPVSSGTAATACNTSSSIARANC